MKVGLFFKEYASHTRQGIQNLFDSSHDKFELYYNDVRQKYDFTITLDDWPYNITPVISRYKILICFEPGFINKYSNLFLKQFDQIHSPNKEISGVNMRTHHVGFPWHFTATIDAIKLMRSEKPRDHSICMISSSKNFTAQHRARLKNIEFLKRDVLTQVDLYGRGFNNFADKAELLSKYQFAIVMENVSQPHYISEKLTDCFLTHTYPIYYGCPNLNDYYPEGSCLDLTHIPQQRWPETIDQFLAENPYDHLMEKINSAKALYLEKHSLNAFVQAMVLNDFTKHYSLSINFNTHLSKRLSWN